MYEKVVRKVPASEIASYLKLLMQGPDNAVQGICSIEHIVDNSLLFFTNTINSKFQLKDSRRLDVERILGFKNIVMITDSDSAREFPWPCIISQNPRLDFERCVSRFFAQLIRGGIHRTAVVSEGARIGENVSIGAHSYIGPEVQIGDNTIIHHNVVIDGPVQIGSHCVIKSNATLGSEGFSFSYDGEELVHFPHLGRLTIGSNVWIGANVCIERAAIDETSIGDHSKIDDLVQIGHNSRVGKAVQVTAGVIVCGRAVLDDGCWIAPNSVIDNGVHVGRDAFVGSASLVRKNVVARSVVAGVPARLLKMMGSQETEA